MKKIEKSKTDITTFWRKPIHPSDKFDIVVCDNCLMGGLREQLTAFEYCPYCGARVIKPVHEDAAKLIEEERLLDDKDGYIAGRAHE